MNNALIAMTLCLWTIALLGVLRRLAASLADLSLLTRYGNERMDYFKPEEIEALNTFHETAPASSLLLAGTAATPWRHQGYDRDKYRALDDAIDWTDLDTSDPAVVPMELVTDSRHPAAFVVITRSNVAHNGMFGLMPIPLPDLEDALLRSGCFQVVYDDSDAVLLRYVALPPVSAE